MLLESETLKTASKYFTFEEIQSIQSGTIPRHIAIIMDGNRRFAKKEAFEIAMGHKSGADVVIDIIKAAKELGVKIMTLYVFSTENWNRSKPEVLALMWLYESYIRRKIPEMVANQMRFDTIGDLSKMPRGVIRAVNAAKEATKDCGAIKVFFAMNYGARDEIKRAFQKMLHDYSSNPFPIESVTEEKIASYLDTATLPDPELLIRTAGEKRVSNFLLWQISYSEIYTIDIFWPEFTSKNLLEAIKEFQRRERRLGK